MKKKTPPSKLPGCILPSDAEIIRPPKRSYHSHEVGGCRFNLRIDEYPSKVVATLEAAETPSETQLTIQKPPKRA